ncbi:MAG: VCBS repeat-containing protein [Gemmatimonadaceae bacterium]|nr:VCBS repeat-containing protein [Gemmatimonadaceae bacterium]
MPRPRLALLALALAAVACNRGDRVFDLLDARSTGIDFANTITTSDSLNELTDVYIYNGAGVAVGDVDNDGLPDIFFAGNMVSSRLYRNRGQMRFEDVTERAHVGTTRWATGVSMVDINGDGWLDIYVSVSGPEWSKPEDRANLLFVNNRDGTFTESAARWGVADTGFTTHAAFLDYDGDGCLDLFLLENAPQDFTRGDVTGHPAGMRGQTPGSYNQLLRNDCHGAFTNVSAQAGILRDAGYGLGVAIADLNGDGRPDIYVSNDAVPNDVVYANGGDGTFANKAGQWLKHTSSAGMGVDVADFNGDGWPDIVQADMLPRDLARRKRMSGYLTWSSIRDATARGFRQDYEINSLQLNNGATPAGDPVFSEIARMAGVARTDWSWSVLFADFDDDGRKDIFIGNGYPKSVNDLDFVNRLYSARLRATGKPTRAALDLLAQLPAYEEPNYVFRNAGDLTFVDESERWGTAAKRSFSYGAAYADLDNDGKLDLVVNNIDGPAFIYHNVRRDDDAHHWLRVELRGDAPNVRALGATVVVTAGGAKQYVYQSPYRGFMSTVDDRPHFGLGRATRADSVEVNWPDGRYQLLAGVAADRAVVLRQSDATARRRLAPGSGAPPVFQPADAAHRVAYAQPQSRSVDFNAQPLLPYQVSRHGPALAVADVDGDGREDLYVGAGNGAPAKLFLQRADGSFAPSPRPQPFGADSTRDDWGALFFDANGDGRPDLYVAVGGYSLAPESPQLQDRLYLNQGGGVFTDATAELPPILTSNATVRAGDFNGDGRLDLFVGGRLLPRSWPMPTRSWILRNDGDHFTDVTQQVAPDLVRPGGMVTDAAWVDYDGDGKLDLVTVGEWMPITFHHNDGARFHDATKELRLPPTRGWWYSLAVGDFDRDGRPDIVAGNLGLNYNYTTSKDTTFGVRAGDLTGNLATSIILTEKVGGKEYPLQGFAPLAQEIYTLGIRFPTYGSFATKTVGELFAEAQLANAVHYEADTFASVFLHNEGGKSFTLSPLPNLAQIAPTRAIVVHDVDGDGNLDLVIAGNLYDAEPNTPRADAGNGVWLRGDGKGRFIPVPPRESGFLAPLDATGLALLKTTTGVGLFVANAGDSLQTFTITR